MTGPCHLRHFLSLPAAAIITASPHTPYMQALSASHSASDSNVSYAQPRHSCFHPCISPPLSPLLSPPPPPEFTSLHRQGRVQPSLTCFLLLSDRLLDTSIYGTLWPEAYASPSPGQFQLPVSSPTRHPRKSRMPFAATSSFYLLPDCRRLQQWCGNVKKQWKS